MSTAPRLEAAKRDWGHDETGCTVLHIDMDAFYASLEVARNPGLKGKPVIIGTGPRAVVSAASYEARKYGINSAMPAARAHQLCPNGIFLPVDMAYYRIMSHRIMHEVFLTVTDRFEQVSVDEGYMDVSAALLEWGRPSAIGAWIRAQVAERFHVTCSVGIACNKLVSKMASTNAKPDGMLLIPAARSAEFVQMMPLRGIPGIGPSLEKRLNAWGVHSVGEITTVREEKSIGSEETLAEDTRDMRVVCGLLRSACDEVTSTLRRKGLVARTLTVKLRFADLSYQTRSFTMERPTDTAGVLYPECVRQLKVMLGLPASAESATPLPKTIRLAGMSTSSLSKAAATAVQPSLDDMLEEADNARGQTSQARLHDAEAALDAVRRKFGNKAAQFGA